MEKYLSTLILGILLLVISILSLFVGAIDIDLGELLSGGGGMELKIFLLSRIPRLLALLCTGVGMSVAGLIRKTSRTLVTSVMSVREEQIVSIYRNVYVAMGTTPIQYYLNCWKPLKTTKLQRTAWNGRSVNVAKAEKICCMVQG